MRASVTILLGTVILFVGTRAISESAQQNEAPSNQSAQDAQTMAEGVFEGILGGGAGEGIVWFGVAAIIMIALGILVASYQGGGR